MDSVMRLLAPRSWLGFWARLVCLIVLVSAENIVFARYFGGTTANGLQETTYFIVHATVVGGPLIAFFLAVTVYQVRLQRKLWRLSRKDELTGLNNRRTFFALLDKVRSQTASGVLLLLDADFFKRINDNHGHLAGDACLKSIAHVLRRNVRQEDIVSRMGGEEFAIFLPGVTPETARVVGERLTKPIAYQAGAVVGLTVTLSVGAAVASRDLPIEAIFQRADTALYQAKRDGRARYRLLDDALLREPTEQPA